MIKTCIENDLVRSIYEEPSDVEKLNIRHTILCDAQLEELFSELQASAKLLDCLMFDPSNIFTDRILSFSIQFSINRANN